MNFNFSYQMVPQDAQMLKKDDAR